MKVKSYPHDGKIGFYEWNLKAQEKFETLIKDCFKEACKFASKKPIYAHISPSYTKKPRPSDVTRIYVSLPLGEYSMDGLDYYLRYDDLVNSFIENNYFRKGVDETEIKFAKDLSVKLRKLADKLDKAADGDE